MMEQKPIRVACYMRVGTKEQLGECQAKEHIYSSRETAPMEDTVKDDGDEHLVQQTMDWPIIWEPGKPF